MKYALYAILTLTTAILIGWCWHVQDVVEQGEQLVTWEMNR